MGWPWGYTQFNWSKNFVQTMTSQMYRQIPAYRSNCKYLHFGCSLNHTKCFISSWIQNLYLFSDLGEGGGVQGSSTPTPPFGCAIRWIHGLLLLQHNRHTVFQVTWNHINLVSTYALVLVPYRGIWTISKSRERRSFCTKYVYPTLSKPIAVLQATIRREHQMLL